jgi:hypothetical protein
VINYTQYVDGFFIKRKVKKMVKKRSAGVTIVGVYAIIISFFLLYIYISVILLPSVNFIAPLMNIIIAISIGMSGIFILRLKNWARILFIFQMIYWVIIGMRGVHALFILDFSGIGKGNNYPNAWIGFGIFSLLPAIIIIYFFTRPRVIEQFKKSLSNGKENGLSGNTKS